MLLASNWTTASNSEGGIGGKRMFFTWTMCRGKEATTVRPAKPSAAQQLADRLRGLGRNEFGGGTGLRGRRAGTVEYPPPRRVNHRQLPAQFQLQHLHAVATDVDADGLNLWPVQSKHFSSRRFS